MIELPCSQCGATLLAEDDWVGKKVKCPDCDGRTLVGPPTDEYATVPPNPPGIESETSTLSPSGAVPAAVWEAITVAGYEVLGELGRGGMGVVYKARHVKLGRLVALKMILVAEHAGQAERARFQTEAEAVARLQHPNIVQIYEVGEQDGRPFFSLEFCRGGSLEKKLGGVPLRPKEAARLAETLAWAMHAAHKAGIVHRDLKPANVLLTKDGTPKIADFGLAKKLDEAGQTATGAVVGTPSYMAPEQASGRSQDIGSRTDVYALGAILYECLTGRPPFRAATVLDTIRQVLSEEPVPPSQVQPKTPRDLETICLKCLRKEPRKRYTSAAALAEDLRRFQNGEPIQARPVGRVERSWRWCRRNPVGTALVAALLLGTAVATVLAVWARGERDRADQNAAAARDNEQQALREKEGKDEQLTRAEWLVYANQLALAEAAWNDNRADLAWDYLDRTRRDYRGWEYHYLATQFLKNHRVFGGHTNIVTAVAFSPDGKRLVSVSLDGTVWLWDAETGQEVRKEHTGAVSAVAFSPDGKRLAIASVYGTVWLWDTETGQEVRALPRNLRDNTAMAFSPDGKRLASGDRFGTVWLWDAETGQEVRALKGHTGPIRCVCFSPDGKRLATASGGFQPGEVKVWDAETGQEVRTLKGHTGSVSAAAFSPDGKRLASASSVDKTVRVWEVETGQEVRTLKLLHPAFLRAVGFSPGLAFSPDGKRLASASDDKMVRLWDVETGQEIRTLKGHTGQVYAVAFSSDGKHLASAGEDKTVRVWDWDAAKGQEVHALKWQLGGVTAVSPDGKRLASASNTEPNKPGEVKVWDAETGQEVRALQGHTGPVTAVAYSPDGKRLASASGGSQPGEAKVWDAETGQAVHIVKLPAGMVCAVALSSDGKRLASESSDLSVRLWDAETGQQVHIVKLPAGMVRAVALSPDGKRLASAEEPPNNTDNPNQLRGLTVWDAETGKDLLTLQGHTGPVTAVAYSPDGKRLASASLDGTLRVWNAENGQEVLILKGHTEQVCAVAFSSDGKHLTSASLDGTVHIWHADR